MSAMIAILLLLAVGAESVTEITDLYGRIKSPNYPNPYPDNLNLTWVINARPGYQVVIFFTVFDLKSSCGEQSGATCAYDYIKLPDVKKGIRLCKNVRQISCKSPRIMQKFRSKSNQMTINFVSGYNEGLEALGFVAHFYQADKDECKQINQSANSKGKARNQLGHCNHFCINVPGSYYCSCRQGYTLHENLRTCTVNCRDQQLRTDSGIINSPNFPLKYTMLTDCDWNIEVRTGLSLNFMFNSTFDIKQPFNNSHCPYDWVKLTYGDREEKFCGSETPHNGQLIRTNTHRARVDFHSDFSVESSGFQLSYTTSIVICNQQPQPPPNGNIQSSQSREYFQFEDQVDFVCRKGYELVGASAIICQNDGTWSDSIPVCQVRRCNQRPQAPINGNISSSSSRGYFQSDDQVDFECHLGYELIGAQTIVCQSDGTWSDSFPICQGRGCTSHPQAPRNGNIASAQSRAYYEFGDQVEFGCNIGYRLIGTQNSVCQNDGTWSDNVPVCQIKSCADPVHLMNVSHSTLGGASSPYTYQDQVFVICNDWYELLGNTQNWTCNENQEWVSNEEINIFLPVCKPICGIKGRGPFAATQFSGGRPARAGEWPWMAYIDLDGGGLDKHRHFCGGSLINERYVITAALCFDDFTERNTKVYLGVHDRRETDDPHIQVFSVDSFEIHSGFSDYDYSELNTDFDNDIAVIRLNQSAIINQWVRPICLPRNTFERSLPIKSMTNDPNYDRSAAIIGWGLTGVSETITARVLQTTRVPMVSTSVCQKDYAKHGLGITDNMLCAGYLIGGCGTCSGDSGAPLSFKWRQNRKWYLNGIATFSANRRCGNAGYSVYTKIQNFLNWIDVHVQW